MARRKGGSIINISSVVGLEGASGMSVYAAAKAAIVGLTKAAAKELAGRNVRVNAIAPGFIDTDLIGGFSAKQREGILSRVPLGRIGTADDVAGAVSFLASDSSSYVTGQVLAVAGGIVV
jgi:3-oxoacyl-[acyl-carrier protein] reductase